MYASLNYVTLLWTGTIGLYAVAYLVGLINITMDTEMRILNVWGLGFLFCIVVYSCALIHHVFTHGTAMRSYLYLAPSAVTVTLYGFAHQSLDRFGHSNFIQEFVDSELPTHDIPTTPVGDIISRFHQAMANAPPAVITDMFIMLLILTPLLVAHIVYRFLPSITVEADAKQTKN